jgi:hypothetical protein
MAKTTKDTNEKSEQKASSNDKSTNDSNVVIKRPMSDKVTKEKEKNDNLIIEDFSISENHLNKANQSKENKSE